MKINCHCGNLIVDQTDSLPCKGYIIPDQERFNLMDAIDNAIEKSGPSEKDKERACMRIRSLFNKVSKTAWQCSSCGALYIEDNQGGLECFQVNNAETSKTVLVSK